MAVHPQCGASLLLLLLFSSSLCYGFPGIPDLVQSSSDLLNHVSLTPSKTSIHVSWDVNDPGDGEAREYRVTWECKKIVRGNLYIDDATEATISGLKPCTEYTVSVTLIDQNGELTGDSVLRETKTLNEAPPAVTGLQSQTKTTKTMILSWEPPATACEVTSYRVQFTGVAKWGSRNPHQDVKSIAGKGADSPTRYALEGLQPYSDYSVTVVAFTSGGAGRKATTNFTTAEGEPSKPVNLKTTEKTATSITATWDEPREKNGVLSQYYVSWYKDGQRIGIQKESHTIHTISGLSPCVEYKIRVAASTAAGKGDFREITQKTDTGTPSQPLDTTCLLNLDQTVSVTWAKPETACPITGFKVSRPGNSLEPNAMAEIDVPSTVFSANFSTVPGRNFSVCVAAVASDTIMGPHACCEPPKSSATFPAPAPPVLPTTKKGSAAIDSEVDQDQKDSGSTVMAIGVGVGVVGTVLFIVATIGFFYWRCKTDPHKQTPLRKPIDESRMIKANDQKTEASASLI